MRAPLLPLLAALPALAQQLDLSTLELTAVGVVDGRPTGIAHAGDGSGRLFVNEKAGRTWIVEPDVRTLAAPFLDIRARVGSGDTVVSQYRVSADPNVADPTSETVFFSADQRFANHNGCQIQLGPDGML